MSINNKEYSWQNMEVYMNGTLIAGIKSIKYKSTRNKELIQGVGSKPHSVQYGTKTYEGELVIYQSELNKMNATAIAAGKEDLTDVTWTLVVAYSSDSNLNTDTLVGVEFSEFEKGMASEDLNAEHTLPFIYLDQTNA